MLKPIKSKPSLARELTKYRCGWCGQPTDVNGRPLEGVVVDETFDNCEKSNGDCCSNEQEGRRIISEEMALDAGDTGLAGQEY